MKLKDKIEKKDIGCTINLGVRVGDSDREKFSIFFDNNGKVIGTDYPFEPLRRFIIFSGKRLKQEIKKCLMEDINTISVDIEIDSNKV